MPPVGVAEVRAIAFVDIAESTRIRDTFGDEAADRMLRAFGDMAKRMVTTHHGVVRRWMGDGLSASFPSASAAVEAAMAIQRGVAAYGRRSDAATPFQIRIGLSVGEVVFDPIDDEEHGVAVVEAARLEPLAPPGAVYATDVVRRLAHRRTNAHFEPVGSRALKGFDGPVDVVQVVDPGANEPILDLPRALSIDERFPLVGRDAAVTSVANVWQRCVSGRGQTLFIFGEPGIGKTRLASQLAAEAHGSQALVLFGGCDADHAVPYQPVAQALAACASLSEDVAAAREGEEALGALFAARPSRRDDASAADRIEMFDAVADAVVELARAQPVLMVLDDLQWARTSTVQLLSHLTRRIDAARVMILALSRAEARSLSHPLNDLFAATPPAEVTALELDPLTVHDVAQLIQTRTAAADDTLTDLARQVCHESSGNAFFACELIDHLASIGDLEGALRGVGRRLGIPDSVRSIVGHRLRRLSPGVSAVLTNAAVCGHTFRVDVVAMVLARSGESVLDAVEECASLGLLQELSVGTFAFRHSILRAVVLEPLSATRLMHAHQRIGEALGVLRPDDHAELAMHWERAGSVERANTHRELAAQQDLRAFAFESALERFELLLSTYATADSAAAGRARLGAGLAQRALGRPEYLANILEAGRVGLRIGDTDLVADAAVGSIWPGTYLRPNEGDPALVRLAEEALSILPEHDVRRPRILSTVGVHHPDLKRRKAILNEARTTAERIGDPTLIGHVLVAEHIADWTPASLDERAAIIARLVVMAGESGAPELEYYAVLFGIFHAVEQGNVAEARDLLARLETPTRAFHGVYLEFMAERITVALDLLTGCDDPQGRVDALAARFGDTHADTANTWAAQTAQIARHQGRLGSMADSIRSVLDGTALRDVFLPGLGMAHLHAGDLASGRAVLESLVEPAFDYFWLIFALSSADLAVDLGDDRRAAAWYDRLTPFRSQLCVAGPGSICYGLVATTLGRIALLLGRHEEALELLIAAMERADAIGAPFEAVRARIALAEAVARTQAEGHAPASAPDLHPGRLLDAASATARRYGFAIEPALPGTGRTAPSAGLGAT